MKTSLSLNGNANADGPIIRQVKYKGRQDGSNEIQNVPWQQPNSFDIHFVPSFTPEQIEPLLITMID